LVDLTPSFGDITMSFGENGRDVGLTIFLYLPYGIGERQ